MNEMVLAIICHTLVSVEMQQYIEYNLTMDSIATGADIVDVIWDREGTVVYRSFHQLEDLGLSTPMQFRDGIRGSGNLTEEAQVDLI